MYNKHEHPLVRHFCNPFLKCQIKSKRLFFELIKNGSMSDRAMDRWMPDFPTLVLDFQKEIIELAAESLQFEKSIKINRLGRVLYTNLFHLVPEKRDKITTELIVHISSGLDNEQDYALKGKTSREIIT